MRNLLLGLILLLLSYAAMAGNHFQEFDSYLHERIDGKYAMKNQLLVAVHSEAESSSFLRQFANVLKTKGLNITKLLMEKV